MIIYGIFDIKKGVDKMDQSESIPSFQKLLLVYGSPSPPGRTASLLQHIEKVVNLSHSNVVTEIIKPNPFESSTIYYWSDHDLEKVEKSQAIIVASPVYRASYPAILKSFFDALPVKALRSKPVALITVGNVAEHYLGVERHFQDILSWFGALDVPATCYILAHELNEGIPDSIQEQLRQLVESTLYLAEKLKDRKLGPKPLAEIYGR